jgi:hypothetical protein
MNTAVRIKEMAGESLSAHCVRKTVLFPKSNDVDHIAEEVCKSLDKQVKSYLTEYSLGG